MGLAYLPTKLSSSGGFHVGKYTSPIEQQEGWYLLGDMFTNYYVPAKSYTAQYIPEANMHLEPNMYSYLEPYCWWTKSSTTKDDDYPIIYRFLLGFNHPNVVQDFFCQQYCPECVFVAFKK